MTGIITKKRYVCKHCKDKFNTKCNAIKHFVRNHFYKVYDLRYTTVIIK